MKKLVLVFLALGVAIGAHAAPMFRNPLPVPTGMTSVNVMLKADFNGDGRDDVLLGGTKLVVLIANGTGPFAALVVTPTAGFSASTLAVGDVNGDGRTDLIVLNGVTDAVDVLLGNGDGSFVVGPSFTSTYPQPRELALADFNGDARLDLVINSDGWSSADDLVAVSFGDGAGHFSGGIATTLGEPVRSFHPADMNGDDKMDLVASGLILLGNGNGAFTKADRTTDGDLVIGDFNHDGKRDVAVTANWSIKVSLGNGDGTLQPAVSYPAGSISPALDVADINGDGHLDLLAASESASAVAVLRGKGDGTFHPAERWVTGEGARLIVADDFDRDGKSDVLTYGEFNFKALSFVRGNGDGTFRTYRSVFTAKASSGDGAGGIPAEMNNDGKVDLVILHRDNSTDLQNLHVLINDGSGKFTPVVTSTGVVLGQGVDSGNLCTGDVNNDGKLDVLVFGRVFRGNGDGTFAAPIVLDNAVAGLPFFGQFDADNNLDLLIAGSQSSVLHRGNGDGTFTAGVPFSHNFVQTVLTGDLNGDGPLDYVSSGIRDVRACINDGNGHFSCQNITDEDSIHAVALADFNGDQKLDVLLKTNIGTQVRFGNGNGTFGAPVSFEIDPLPGFLNHDPVRTADFDRDGNMDVAFATTVYFGDGHGRFPRAAQFRTDHVDAMHVADIDGSGSPDLVVLNSFDHDIDLLLTYTTADPTAQSSLDLTADRSSAAYASPIQLTATVSGSPILLTGRVAFAVDGQPVALRAVDLLGKTTLSTPFFPGLHNITATYVGDENYVASDDATGVSIVKAKTTATVNGTSNPEGAGRTVTITTVLTAPQAEGWPGPTGARTLREGNTPLGVALVNGKATISTLTIGSHVITFDYAGDANYEPATASYTQVITKPSPTVRIEVTPAAEPFMAGAPMTFRAFFKEAGVTGTIRFSVDNVDQGSLPLTNGSASIQRSFPWGHHSVFVVYSGDATWSFDEFGIGFDVFIGAWGTPMVLNASGFPGGSLHVQWSQIGGAASYTIWRKQSVLDGWQAVQTYPATENERWFFSLPTDKSFLYAVTATDGSGNVSPMSAPDLATTIPWSLGSISAGFTRIKAKDIVDLRTAVGNVRTFANLTPFTYSTPVIAAGQPVRASDVQELRTALTQARTAIGLPAITWTTPPVITPGAAIRAAHILELRSGVN